MFDSIEEIIEEAKLGKPFIITDDEDRENEGDIYFSCAVYYRRTNQINDITCKRLNLRCNKPKYC